MPFEKISKLGCDRQKKPRRHCFRKTELPYFSRGISFRFSPPQTCRGSQARCFAYSHLKPAGLLFWANSHISIRRFAFDGFFSSHINWFLARMHRIATWFQMIRPARNLFLNPNMVVDFPTDVMITNKAMGIFFLYRRPKTLRWVTQRQRAKHNRMG